MSGWEKEKMGARERRWMGRTRLKWHKINLLFKKKKEKPHLDEKMGEGCNIRKFSDRQKETTFAFSVVKTAQCCWS